MEFFELWSFSSDGVFRTMEFFELWSFSSYGVFRTMEFFELWRFSSYGVFRTMEFFELWRFSSYGDFRVMEYFELWRFSSYGVFVRRWLRLMGLVVFVRVTELFDRVDGLSSYGVTTVISTRMIPGEQNQNVG